MTVTMMVMMAVTMMVMMAVIMITIKKKNNNRKNTLDCVRGSTNKQKQRIGSVRYKVLLN